MAALVLLLHATLLGLWPRTPGPGWQGGAARPVQVRQIVLAAPALPAAAPAPAAVARATPHAAPRKVEAAAPSAAAAPETAATAPAIDPAPEPGGQAVPVYATQLPPPVVIQYELKRGLASGRAELRWLPSADGPYELTLRTEAYGQQALGWASRGVVDAHGVAPERYVESRRGRELRTVNFQRDKGLITFSGPQLEYPLVPGAQDRVSWMIQLAAVLAADPALAAPGSTVTLLVATARGATDLWTFSVMGVETTLLASGPVAGTLHLRREPLRPYDTTAEVWLDPARHHLPVRAKLLVRPTGEGTEFVLQSLATP